MSNAKSIGELLGSPQQAEEAKEGRVSAVQDLWRGDFRGAPEWFVKKYFVNDEGHSCGRMHVKAFARVGDVLTEDGKPLMGRNGRPRRLTTAYLAKKVEADMAEAGFPGVRVHFRGYSLDPVRFCMPDPLTQEEFEQNESRHVPGLDPDEAKAPSNGTEALDREAYESLSCFAMNALRAQTLMYWGLDEDFARIVLSRPFVHSAHNAWLRSEWARVSSMVNMETLSFVAERNDFSLFEPCDVVRTYTRALRALTGKEYGDDMLEDAALLDPAMDLDYVRACLDGVRMGTLTPESACRKEEFCALIAANLDPTDAAPQWESDARGENLFDDDDGQMATDLILAY